jgi:hypothetical protein
MKNDMKQCSVVFVELIISHCCSLLDNAHVLCVNVDIPH